MAEKVQLLLKNVDVVIPKQSVENFLPQVKSVEGQKAIKTMMATTALPASVTGDMMEYLFEVLSDLLYSMLPTN